LSLCFIQEKKKAKKQTNK